MRFLFPQAGPWLAIAFAVVALLGWRVRWWVAAFTAGPPLRRFRWRASPLRRLPFVVLAAAAAFVSLALMQPVIPYSQADVQSRGLDIVLLIDLSSSMQEDMGSGQSPARVLAPTGRTRMD